MAAMKTIGTDASVRAFLDGITDEQRRRDCQALVEMMTKATRAAPRMWGSSIVGFGQYHYKYASGREGDWFLTGFSPRTQNLTVYIVAGFERYGTLMKRLGPHKTGKSCLYLKSLEQVDVDVLQELIDRSVRQVATTYPS